MKNYTPWILLYWVYFQKSKVCRVKDILIFKFCTCNCVRINHFIDSPIEPGGCDMYAFLQRHYFCTMKTQIYNAVASFFAALCVRR
ncbi:hypothetical protein AI2699V1_1234 [Klebsiella oxytoca]|nr:hypothetical protein AI2699V1_1234 [Klebsiella oxytoca]CAH3670819.1 hypothetical protein AI2699V1_1234 [Klebsiella oxytoca]